MKNLPLIVFAGLITGALAAIVQLFFNVYPPYAYGLCVACHARDLINWLVNVGTGLNLSVAGVSVVVPVLTVIGIVLGAFIGSKQTREFRFKTTKNPLTMFILGFLVMISALILGACPLRTILRIAYGDIIAIIGFVCIVVGVLVSVQLLKWNTKRNTKDLEAL
ncbi:MAG: YeeE/YedE thiosulfate transporter family protein [Candidatus Bathyarchaeota archaeon]|jgi:YedE family putative selenium metabolism protein|nr:YeeE/YedE thiosulfate transporter family protein [Candidatus Bathyarchaeota archaeon]MDI9578716.1 YeeE/YedE thiosulfate transporter family protein [Thermoproteota archaeon]NLD66260.1 YeeE/YedE family protein [Thermoproteota archaeon]